MKISNKLNTADFVELQKIMMELYGPGKVMIFILKYLVNFLYALVVVLGLYFILYKFANIENLVIPSILGVFVFGLLVYFYPKIYRGRLNRAIERFYSKTELNIERNLVLNDEGFTATDSKGVKKFSWSGFDRIVKSAGNYFLKLKGESEGFIIKADHLSPDEAALLETYLNRTGLKTEERKHE